MNLSWIQAIAMAMRTEPTKPGKPRIRKVYSVNNGMDLWVCLGRDGTYATGASPRHAFMWWPMHGGVPISGNQQLLMLLAELRPN